MLVEFVKQIGETAFGPTLVVGEQFDEGVENDELGVDAFDGCKETGQVLWEGEGTVAGGV